MAEQINLVQTAVEIADKREYLKNNRKVIGKKLRKQLNRDIGNLVRDYNKAIGFKAIKW